MIVDANVVVSALLGRSLPLLQAVLDRGIVLVTPEQQMREIALVTATRAAERGVDPAVALTWATRALLVIPSEFYGSSEAAARMRLSPAGQKDWPLVALAITSRDDIWSHDTHLFGAGIAVWHTRNIAHAQPMPYR
jgi:predicted nucleic acid-binding protein